ncbi:MAG: TonB-dependent receptor, partial [Gemmatimonadetes bacterium]|nr:TonB-dependent receptor [Gemmatimonadota bacterium]
QYGDKFTQLNVGRIEGLTTMSLGTGSTNVIVDSLHPERQAEIEAGIDGSILGGRGNLEFTGYQRKVTDLLINRSLLSSTGFTTARFNGATIRTRGLEVSLALVPIQKPSVQWQTRTTFSRDNTIILDMSGVPPFNAAGSFNFGAARFFVDSSATAIYGTDTLPGCMTTWPNCPIAQPVKVGNLNPQFTMGFNSDLKIKAFSFNFLLSWQQGGLTSDLTRWLIDLAGTTRDYGEPCVNGCLPGETLGGQRARLFPAFVTRINVSDATYLKLREVTLGYELPRSLTSKFWSNARFVRLSASGRNLITLTRYTGMDPEVANNGSRNIRIGFDDIAPYPPSRAFWFSVDVGF